MILRTGDIIPHEAESIAEVNQAGTVSAHRVFAVVISFNPDLTTFLNLIDALLPQVVSAIVVDNASSSDMRSTLGHRIHQNIEILQLDQNYGIAAAQNAGIERAIGLGADFVLLMDQDSLPSKFLVAELLTGYLSACNCPTQTRPVAAIGPSRVDSRTQRQSFFMVRGPGFLRQWRKVARRPEAPSFIETDFLIASGTLIPIEVLKDIGGMRSNYFIDHVDREWCFRAKAAGYRLLGAPASQIDHSIGDSIKRVFPFSKLEISWHPPLRNYYLFRNALLMQRDVTISWPWKIYLLWRLIRYAGGIFLISETRRQRLQFIMLGLLHGYRGLGGRLDPVTNQCASVSFSTIDPAH